MFFREYANYLNVLENTSSRLEITKTLSELIGKMHTDETAEGIYLSQGLLGPVFDNREFGMATKMVSRSVAYSYEVKIEEVERVYKATGDLGETVLVIGKSFGDKNLTITEVFDLLKKVAYLEGAGSQEQKIALLSELVRSVSPIEAKYIVRIVVGKLRLGFSEKTVFDAVSNLENGDKKLRKELDKVYQYYPDSGEIVKIYKSNGMNGLRKIENRVGVPVVSALCQRLNTYKEIVDNMGTVAVEPKYDGTRVQIHFSKERDLIRTYTRNLEENSHMFPELLILGKILKAKEVILDCEAVGIDETGKILPFQMTITRKRKHGVEEASMSVPLRFFVFDILNLDGKSLLGVPYSKRRDILENIILENKVLVVDEYHKEEEVNEIEKWHENFLKLGYEGAVLKKWDGEYLPGRQGWNWVKIKESEGTEGKLSDTFDLVVMGYYLGRGKRAGFGMGAFLVGTKKENDWVSLAKIGTGLTDDEFKDLTLKLDNLKTTSKPESFAVEKNLEPDVWVHPIVVVEIAADEVTKSPSHTGGIALRFPRLIKFRDDKGPDQATTWEEVLRIGKVR